MTVIPARATVVLCRRCSGDGRELVDVLVGTRYGQPLYQLQPRNCARCDGLGYLPFRRYRGTANRPSPQPAASSRTAA